MENTTYRKPLLVTLLFIFISCFAMSNDEFVKVENGRFMLHGKPYYYFGTNFWHGAYLAADLVPGDRQRLLLELDQLAAYKITNLRIMAASEASELEMSVRPSFQSAPGVYNEQLLAGLDFLLNELDKRNMKAVLVLNNYWQWSGGMSQYMNWVTGKKVIDPDKTGDWDGFQAQSAEFYANAEANKIFRDYIYMLVNRTNTVSGKKYKDDPVIMSWQLANEPRPAPDAPVNEQQRKIFAHWVSNTAGYIHSIAPNQLVSSGNEGEKGSRDDIHIFSESHKCDNIDYLTFHIWPKNWGWYKVENAETTFGPTIEKTLNYFAEHIEVARQHNKPIVLEEFGLERDNGAFAANTPTTYRDKYLDLLFQHVVDSAAGGSPMAGLNFWAWGGMATAASGNYIWKEGDSFMGDPPQEPQGLNSVFSSDSTTLEIFRKYNDKLENLVNTR